MQMLLCGIKQPVGPPSGGVQLDLEGCCPVARCASGQGPADHGSFRRGQERPCWGAGWLVAVWQGAPGVQLWLEGHRGSWSGH